MKYHINQQLDFPITVYINSDMTQENQDVAIDAILTWNNVMGEAVFSPVISDTPVNRSICGTIYVSTHDLPKNYVGYTWWSKCSAECQFEPQLSKKIATITMIHELGHALNLRHEKDEKSVLHAHVGPDQHISDLSQCLVELALTEAGVD